MNNKVVFGQYFNSDSWIHRLDPRTKIISIFVIIISLFLINSLVSLAIAFTIVIAIILTSKIPFMKFLNSLKMMTMLLFITVFIQVLFNRGEEAYPPLPMTITVVNLFIILLIVALFFLSKKIIRRFRFLLFLLTFFLVFFIQYQFNYGLMIYSYEIIIYKSGIMTSMLIILRIISLIFISTLLTLTTKPTELNNGLEEVAKPLKWIGIKVNILSMMISISLRFIPTLLNEADKILKAQASRGVDFREGKFKEKVTQIISLLIPMFVISYKRAADLADAMEARGYIPGEPRTNINLLKYHMRDFFAFSFVVLVVISLVSIKILSYLQVINIAI